MVRKISVKCPHCNEINSFYESELVSGVPRSDKNGNVIEEHPPVVVDVNTLVKCEYCSYPVSCANATFSD
jgi:hypothetical protein